MKEGSPDVHCCSVTSVRYVYVYLYFYNMRIPLNLYSLKLLASVNTGCNILHENCAKRGLIFLFNVRHFCSLFFNLPSEFKKEKWSNYQPLDLMLIIEVTRNQQDPFTCASDLSLCYCPCLWLRTAGLVLFSRHLSLMQGKDGALLEAKGRKESKKNLSLSVT